MDSLTKLKDNHHASRHYTIIMKKYNQIKITYFHVVCILKFRTLWPWCAENMEVSETKRKDVSCFWLQISSISDQNGTTSETETKVTCFQKVNTFFVFSLLKRKYMKFQDCFIILFLRCLLTKYWKTSEILFFDVL